MQLFLWGQVLKETNQRWGILVVGSLAGSFLCLSPVKTLWFCIPHISQPFEAFINYRSIYYCGANMIIHWTHRELCTHAHSFCPAIFFHSKQPPCLKSADGFWGWDLGRWFRAHAGEPGARAKCWNAHWILLFSKSNPKLSFESVLFAIPIQWAPCQGVNPWKKPTHHPTQLYGENFVRFSVPRVAKIYVYEDGMWKSLECN